MPDLWCWRRMQPADLAVLEPIADAIHPDFPEDAAVFAERLQLYPAGCHVLEAGHGITGYVISHPWHEDDPPPLNRLLGALPERPASYYIHDLALLPTARGTGAAAAIVAQLAAHAKALRLSHMALIAVGRSPPFWRRQGFREAPPPAGKLASYGPSARFMACDLSPPPPGS